MTTHVTAFYERGVLRPTAPLSLEEGTQVEIIVIEPLREGDAAQVADILAAIAAPPITGGDIDPRDTYPLLHRALRDEGWDDPRMDEYNLYGCSRANHVREKMARAVVTTTTSASDGEGCLPRAAVSS